MTTQRVWKRKPTSSANDNDNDYIPATRQRQRPRYILEEKPAPYCHMSICEAIQLKEGDVIDHRGHDYKFKEAIIKAKRHSSLRIHYYGSTSKKCDFWSDYLQELDRFAFPRSISRRKAHRLQYLKAGDFVDINPLKVDPGWKCGKITKMDCKSGQVCVEYMHGKKQLLCLYWTHLDNLQEINQQTSSNENYILTLSENNMKRTQSKLLAMGYNTYYIRKAMEEYLQIYKDSNYTKIKTIVKIIQKIQKEQHQKTSNKNEILFQQQTQFLKKADSFISMLTLDKEEDKEDNYKEELYKYIAKIKPEYAGKITGMLLELDPNYVKTLLIDTNALNIYIKQAMDVILIFPKLSAMGFASEFIEKAIYQYHVNQSKHIYVKTPHRFNKMHEIIKIIDDLQKKNKKPDVTVEQRLLSMGYDPHLIQTAMIQEYNAKTTKDISSCYQPTDINQVIQIMQSLVCKQQQIQRQHLIAQQQLQYAQQQYAQLHQQLHQQSQQQLILHQQSQLQIAIECKLNAIAKESNCNQTKKAIGDELFAKIAEIGPTFISKITGMIMEFDINKLILLNNDQNYLLKTVNEAVAFLKANNYIESEQKVEAGNECPENDNDNNNNNTYDEKKEGENEYEVAGDNRNSDVVQMKRLTLASMPEVNDKDLSQFRMQEMAEEKHFNSEWQEEKNYKNNQQKYRKKSKKDIIFYMSQQKKIAKKWIKKAMTTYERMYGDRYNVKVISEIVERVKNKEFIQIDSNKVENPIRYDLWSCSDALKWIINVDNMRFRKYQNILAVKLKEEGMNGMCLIDMNKNDFHRIGIINDKDKEILLQKIAEMLKQNANCYISELQIEGC